MIFPFLATTILFCFILRILLHKNNSQEKKQEETFWERERRANSVRRKPLDDLDYITIPIETFPTELFPEDEKIQECIQTIRSLTDKKIVNFTGYTNTDLKIKYGAPNIGLLMQYDQNYTLLVRILQKWANALYDKGEPDAARILLEFAVSTHTDVSGTYSLLCTIYKQSDCPEKIPELITTAKELKSIMRDSIIQTLQKSNS